MTLLPSHRPLKASRFIPGLALVVLGGLAATVAVDLWAELTLKVQNPWLVDKLERVGSEWHWLRWVLGSVFVVIGGSFLRSKFLFFLVTSILIFGAGLCVFLLLGLDLSMRPIVLISLALGFMIHAAPAVSPPSLRGIAGLALVIAAVLGGTLGPTPPFAKGTLSPVDAELEQAWAVLAEQNSVLPENVRQPNEETGETWQYLGSFQADEGTTWIHKFRHRMHPSDGEQHDQEIEATPGFSPPQSRIRSRNDRGRMALVTTSGFYNWRGLGAQIGPKWKSTLDRLSAECTWGITLLLTAIGVSLSSTRPIHFLNAVLVGTLAFFCIQQGKIGTFDFTELGKGLIDDVDWKYVESWRWVAAASLLSVAVGLLHAALGFGAVTACTGIAWLIAGLCVMSLAGTESLVRLGGGIAPLMLPNMGMPEVPPGSTSAPQHPVNPSKTNRSLQPQLTPADQERALKQVTQFQWRQGTEVAWMALTALIAGIITITGCKMLSSDRSYRMWLGYGLWMAFGLGLGILWAISPRRPDETWLGWIAGWGLTQFRIHACVILYVGTLAIAGGWALRSNTPLLSWIQASIGLIMAGTMLSLIAIAIVIKYGGFSSMPAWKYGIVALLQSSLAWALLLYTHLPAGRRRMGDSIA